LVIRLCSLFPEYDALRGDRWSRDGYQTPHLRRLSLFPLPHLCPDLKQASSCFFPPPNVNLLLEACPETCSALFHFSFHATFLVNNKGRPLTLSFSILDSRRPLRPAVPGPVNGPYPLCWDSGALLIPRRFSSILSLVLAFPETRSPCLLAIQGRLFSPSPSIVLGNLILASREPSNQASVAVLVLPPRSLHRLHTARDRPNPSLQFPLPDSSLCSSCGLFDLCRYCRLGRLRPF